MEVEFCRAVLVFHCKQIGYLSKGTELNEWSRKRGIDSKRSFGFYLVLVAIGPTPFCTPAHANTRWWPAFQRRENGQSKSKF